MRHFDKLNLSPRVVEVFGRFPLSTEHKHANKTWAYASAKVITFTYTTAATQALQNAFSIGIADTSAGAYGYTFSTTNNDCNISTDSDSGWYVEVTCHSHAGAGVLIYEDTSAEVLTVCFEAGVSTMTDFKTAINANCTQVRAWGGTATGVMTLADDVLVRTAMNVNTLNVWFTTQSATTMRVAAVITGSAATAAQVLALVNESTLANKKITGVLTTGTGSDDVTTALSNTVLSTVTAVDAIDGDYSKPYGSYTSYISHTYDTGKTAEIFYTQDANRNLFTLTIADATAKACAHTFSSTGNDAIFVAFDATGWSTTITAGAALSATEDTAGKTLACVFVDGVTQIADLCRLINRTCTKVRAYGWASTTAMAATTDEVTATNLDSNAKVWPVTQNSSDLSLKADMGSSATFAQIAALVNESTLHNNPISMSSAQSGYFETELSATTLGSEGFFGEGFTVSRTGAAGTGEYTLTLDRGWLDAQLLECETTMQLPTAEGATYAPVIVRNGLYAAASKTVVLTTYNRHTPGVVDPGFASGRYINFNLKFIVNR